MSWDPGIWPSDPRIRRGFELIGGTVKRRRERLRLSQRQLQQLSGVQQSVISRLENGKLTGIRWQRFARLVDALDGLEVVAPPREHPPWPGPAGRRPPPPDDPDGPDDPDDDADD